MIISYPILPSGATTADEDDRLRDFLATYVDNASGFFPVSFDDRWHGGIHLKPGNEPLRAIADGEVIAYRVATQAETYPGAGDYDTSFVLLKHTTETGENTPVVFYSLLMHLLGRSLQTPNQQKQLPDWLKNAGPSTSVKSGNGTKVWRKDILGFCGKYLNEPRVHFEIFATDADLGNFWKDSSTYTATHSASNDWFGDAGFVIPAGKNFLASHPHAAAISGLLSAPAEAPVAGANSDSPAGATTSVDSTLAGAPNQGQGRSGAIYVSVRLVKGDRIATSFKKLPNGKFVQVGQPIVQKDYEYQLYHLATKLYPDCPSAGFEWLRFGRVLGPDTTAINENWQLVRYDDSKSGYIDLAVNDIISLSDADFPFWNGWQKISEGAAINAQDGICDAPKLLDLIHGAAPTTSATPSMTDQKTDFIQHATAQGVSDALRFVVAQHPSEWDDSDLDTRYAKERKPGGDLQEAKSWNDFSDHVKKMAFWSNAGLARDIWHFHPGQFIAQYRRCLWLTTDEFAQSIPRKNLHLDGARFNPQIVASWLSAKNRAATWAVSVNKSNRKYCISSTQQRLTHYVAQLIDESGYFRYVKEGNGEHAPYAPWYGRGLIQITHEANYKAYGNYRAFSTSHSSNSAPFQSLGWNPNTLIATSESQYDADNCADSAGFYWICSDITANGQNVLETSDAGANLSNCIEASRATNGNVPQQNINGLDVRVETFTFLRYYFMDFVAHSSTESITFDWRRNSHREPLFHVNGTPIVDLHGNQKTGYILVSHTIQVPLNRQIP